MSTRSQIRFVQRIDQETDGGESETIERVAQLYRHWDGYPESVLPDLLRLKEVLDRTATERGPEYTAAQFVFLGKLQRMGFYLGREPERCLRVEALEDLLDPASFEHLDQPLFLLGHGVENPSSGIHGDEEFLYVVDIPYVEFGERSEWRVQVSAHGGFPRWDGPTEEAFERAAWQFEGPLEEAIEAFDRPDQ